MPGAVRKIITMNKAAKKRAVALMGTTSSDADSLRSLRAIGATESRMACPIRLAGSTEMSMRYLPFGIRSPARQKMNVAEAYGTRASRVRVSGEELKIAAKKHTTTAQDNAPKTTSRTRS